MNQFDIEGVYLETCGCGDNCHCCEPGGHTQPGCQVKATWRIDKGEAGNTSLAGVTLAAIYDHACVESRGSQGRLLVNDGTTPEQRRALAQVFASQSQMQPAGMGRLLQDLTQTEYAQVSVVQQGDRFQVQVNGTTEAILETFASTAGARDMEVAQEITAAERPRTAQGWRGPRTFAFISRFRWVG